MKRTTAVGRAAGVADGSDWQRIAQGALLSTARQVLAGGPPRRLSIMIFHRVLATADPFLAADPTAEQLAAVMGLVRERFVPLSLAEGLGRLVDGTLPPRSVCVTFDDGYADNLLVAAPILNALEIPATVFVASGYLDGTPMWNDRVQEAVRRCPGDLMDLRDYDLGIHRLGDATRRAQVALTLLHRLKYLPATRREQVARDMGGRFAPDMVSPMLTRDQVRQLRAKGIEIGGHTVSHPILACTEDAAAYREIAENKEDLEGLLGERLRFFAYPNGKPVEDFAPIHTEMVRRIGYQAALTTRPGVATAATDPYGLPRFTPWDRTPLRFGLRLVLNMRRIVQE